MPGKAPFPARAFALAFVCLLVTAPAHSLVDFPAPAVMETASDALSAVALSLEPGKPAYLVAGSGDGAIAMFSYSPGTDRFQRFSNFFVGGELVDLIPWEGRPLLDQGVVAATANPDRVVFVRVLPQTPYFIIEQTVELEEDPGSLSFVGELVGGTPELAVSLPGIDQVALLREEAGLWDLTSVHDAGDRPASIVGVDLDGDQVRELVTANRGALSGNLGIFKRDPAGEYSAVQQDFPAGTPTHLAAYDLDGNGRRELVATVEGVPELILLDAVAGQLVPSGSVALTLPADGLHLTNLFDGTVGLFASNRERGLVDFYRLDGGSWSRISAYYPGCHPLSMASGDFNGDGGRDLVAVGGSDNVLTVMFANPQPGFWGYPAMALSASPGSSEIADFDGDGLRDLVVANGNLPLLSIFPGLVGGGFASTPVGFDLTFYPGALAVVDTDTDPGPELAILDGSGDRILIADYSAGSGFTLVSEMPTGDAPSFIASRDLDDDGFDDLMIITREADEITLLFGAGNHTFPEQSIMGLDNGADWITPLDLDADGLPDLVFSDGVNRIWTIHNRGDRTFDNLSWMNAGSGAGLMTVGDLDEDGDEDLVVVNGIDESLSMFENTGTGVLNRRIGAHTLTSRPLGIAVRDMDGDNRAEIVMNFRYDHVLGVSFPLSSWTYSQAATFSGGPNVADFKVDDFNFDGVPDILTLDQSLMLGLTLLNVEQVFVAVEPTALAVECDPLRLEIRVRPDRPGPWTVALGSEGGWLPLADTGTALVGGMDYDRGTWIITVDRRELAGSASGTLLRLTVGEDGDRESLDLDLKDICPGAPAADLPRITWAREPWPNPFNPLVNAMFTLGRGADVSVGVYDLAGRRVALLAEGWHGAGDHSVQWNGRAAGRPAGAGVYLLRISTPENVLIHKVMLIK